MCTIYIQSTIYTIYIQNKVYASWIYCAPTELVHAAVWHGTEHVSDASAVQYQRIYVWILFWKIMLNRILIAILWPISGLLKQIINHNRSKFALSKLVLSGVCCKHFMYTCMHCSCTCTCLCARGVLTSKIQTIFF